MGRESKKQISRRDFLGGAAALGAMAAAATAMPGCAPKTSTSEASATASSSSATGQHTWDVKPAAITDISDTKDFDIVIVGAGIAGLNAAEAAARNGAKVAVLERSDTYSMRGIDVGHVNSTWQKNNGREFDPRELTKLEYFFSQQTANYDLIYTWASQSGKVFDHIQKVVEAHGYHEVSALSATAKYGWDTLPERFRVYEDAISIVKDGDAEVNPRPDGKSVNWNFGDVLSTAATENGAEFFFKTHAEQLVGDATSGITGVIATDGDGRHVQYNAKKGVILATGDIAGNQEMVDAWAPICNRADSFMYTPAGCNTGDAILMGKWAGAGLYKSPAAPMVHQFVSATHAYTVSAFFMSWLAVNSNGERYGADISFEPYLTSARLNTPDNKAWSIFDADYPKYVQQQWPTKYEQWLDGVEDAIKKSEDSDGTWQANTLDELAQKIGVPADALKKSVERYNSMYDAGNDSDFDVPAQFLSRIQTPPFYATKLVCSVLVIPFGLHVDNNSQVCTDEDKPIKGLFAIGNCQGDFFGFNYPVHCPGISHGRCVTFGQLVGEALALDTVLTKNEYK